MKIKCYDNYNKQSLIISFPDDEIDLDSFSSNYAYGKISMRFEIVGDGEDPNPKRWSDLKNFKIIKEFGHESILLKALIHCLDKKL